MVRTATSYSRQGLRDWIVQRMTAVVLGLFSLYLLYFTFCTPNLNFELWQALFASTWMKTFSLLALLCLMLHAWIGVWTVLTDYVKPMALRLFLEVSVVVALVCYFIWGFKIIWSV
jgi:succinate dehydrogenase / fumarate reductase membrane anchor subunit